MFLTQRNQRAGKDLLRALHEAPNDIAAWLDPAVAEGKAQENMKHEKFKSLRETLVSTLAKRSVSCPCRASMITKLPCTQ